MVKEILKKINSIQIPRWLVLILALCLILRIPSFFEPYSYGDETIYLALGEGVRQGKVLYKDIHDNKPPLLYFTAAVAGNLFWFKAILAFSSFITIFLFWKLISHLFPSKDKLQKIATLIFALFTTIPLLEGNIANAENFMIGLIIAGFLVLLTQKENPKNLILGGVLFSLATLFKVPAAFDLPAIIFYWLIVDGLNIKNIKRVIRNTVFIAIGFFVPIAFTLVWYYIRGAGQSYLISAFLQNFGYLSTFRPNDTKLPFLAKNAPLLTRGALTFAGIAILYPLRKKLSKEFIFLTVWLFLTLFAVTLSERPYPHYLLQSSAPASALFAMLFTLASLEQVFVILPLTVLLAVPVYYKFWYYSTTAYYSRFLEFAAGRTTKEEYLAKFGSHVPRAYKISEFINGVTRKSDGVFVWGPENQTIYALSRRFPPIKYVAQYHINDFSSQEEVMDSLNSNLPKIIVILPESQEFPELGKLVGQEYILIEKVDGAYIYFKNTMSIR